MNTQEASKEPSVIEARHGLSPLQEGMLLHHVLDPHSGVDIEQIVVSLREAVDATALRAAWEQVVSRHQVLRTVFRWENVPAPVQEVLSGARLRFIEEDWRDVPAAEQASRLAQFLAADRRAGFRLSDPPLLRVALLRTDRAAYELVWTFHHIILDGRSFPLLLEEIFAFYEAGRVGDDPDRPVPPPFGEYLAWVDKRDARRSEGFWRKALAGFSAPTPLPLRRVPEPAAGSSAGLCDAALDAATTARLEALAGNEGFSLGTIVQGAWALLLSRYSGEKDVVFGVTRTTRRSSVPGADHMIGLLINTVPLRVSVPEDAHLIPWLREVRARWQALRDHEHTPLRLIQSWSEVREGAPLFESLLVYETYLLDTLMRQQGAAWKNRRIRVLEQTNYPLTLVAYGGLTLTLRLEFDRRRVDQDTALAMLSHLRTILTAIAEDAHLPLSAVSMVSESERRALLRQSSGGRLDYPSTATIHELVSAQIHRTPDAIAVTDGNACLTYAELDRRAEALAAAILGADPGPSRLVGVCLERTADLVVGLLAVLRAGCAYVPLDPAYPPARLRFILEDAAARVVVSQTSLAGHLAGHPASLVLIDAPADEGRWPSPRFTAAAGAEDPAYLIYTSGSTGQPKGVVIRHRNAVAFIAWAQTVFSREDLRGVLAATSICFDLSVFEIFVTLCSGGAVVVAPHALQLHEIPASIPVTLVNTVPSVMEEVLRAGPLPETVRVVNLAGEPLSQRLVEDLYSRPHVDRVYDLYGPSEDTTYSTYTLRERAGRATIGRPIANTQAYVLDERQHPVPIGISGELYLGGDGVALGYLNRADLTAERFIQDPFAEQPGARMYRTGDLVRYLPDGNLEYLGRLDHQVKVRGFRIELGEVEAVIGQYPAVRETVVLAREDTQGIKRLVAYYTEQGPEPVSPPHLRAFLLERIPDHMVPAAFLRLDSLPLTPNGKIDRRALPAPAAGDPREPAEYVGPRTATEEVLCQIWAEVLRLPRVGVHENFFELGGDSILNIQITSRARQAGLALRPGQIFKHRTVADLAAAVEPAVLPSPPVEQSGPGTIALTPIQHWFFEQRLADQHHWNQAFLFETLEDLDSHALETAVAHLARHHDALRLRFASLDGHWRQTIAETETNLIRRVDLTELAEAELARAIVAETETAARALDLERGPLLGVVHLVTGRGRRSRLLLVVHHLAVDGISWRILREDLETGYRQARAGEPVLLPARTTSFRHWAAVLQAHARSAAAAAELPFWEAVGRAPLLHLPLEGKPAEDIEGAATTVTVTLSEDETRELLQRVPTAYNTQINDVLLTALSDALGPLAGAGDLLVDVEGHGREEIGESLDLTRTVGWFTSVFPLRLPVGTGGEIGTRLKAVKELLRSVPHRGLGFGVLRYLRGSASLATLPRADIAFNYLGQLDQITAGSTLLTFAPEPAGPWHAPRARRRYPIEVIAVVLGGRLELRWSFGTRRLGPAAVGEAAERMGASLRRLIEHCLAPTAGGRTPSDFPLVRLPQEALDRLVGNGRGIEEIGPLAPMQALFLPGAGEPSDTGFEQWRYGTVGPLDVPAFRRAWQWVVDRHEILRTSFAADGLAEPVQMVHRRADIEITEVDLRGSPPAEQRTRLDALLAADRQRGFDPGRPPLTRLILVRSAEAAWECVWSYHHLLIDRWSFPLVLRDVGAAYEAYRAGRTPPGTPTAPYRRYLAWLGARDRTELEAYWRDELKGINATVSLSSRGGAPDAPDGERLLMLSVEESERVRHTARRAGLTTNTLITGAWGIWLARTGASDDVLFGVTVSGRPAELSRVDEMVGLFINNLPVRLRLRRDEPAAALLQRLQARQSELERHAEVSLEALQAWSGLPWHQRLFESLIVFQHHAADQETEAWLGPTIRIEPRPVETRTSYPLALVVSGDETISLRLAYRGRLFDAATAQDVLVQVREIVLSLADRIDASLGAMLDAIGSPLIRLDGSRPTGSPGNPVAPRTSLEWLVARVWAELLGRNEIGMLDNFFDLGGQSLVATQIVSRLRDALRMEVPVSFVFAHPTVAGLTTALTTRETAPGHAERIAGLIRRVEEMSDAELLKAEPSD